MASKYRNRKVTFNGQTYDSKKELLWHQRYVVQQMASDPAQRVVEVRRQVQFILIPQQEGERQAVYTADFVVDYADGRQEVVDVKSPPTRRLPDYVLRRKLMLHVHGIRIKEV